MPMLLMSLFEILTFVESPTSAGHGPIEVNIYGGTFLLVKGVLKILTSSLRPIKKPHCLSLFFQVINPLCRAIWPANGLVTRKDIV